MKISDILARHLFSAVAVSSHAETVRAPDMGFIANQIKQDLARTIAQSVAESNKLVITEQPFSTTYRMEVLIISPEEFIAIAREMAFRLAARPDYVLLTFTGVKP